MSARKLVEKLYSCFGNADLPGVLACLAPDVKWEVVGPSEIPFAGEFCGWDGVTEFFSRLMESQEILEFMPEQFIESTNSVAVIGRERSRSKKTGREFSVRWVQVFECADGAITTWREFIDTQILVEAHKQPY